MCTVSWTLIAMQCNLKFDMHADASMVPFFFVLKFGSSFINYCLQFFGGIDGCLIQLVAGSKDILPTWFDLVVECQFPFSSCYWFLREHALVF